jgi:hypothetical protein
MPVNSGLRDICPRILATICSVWLITIMLFPVADTRAASVRMDCEATIKAWVLDGYYRPGECYCSGGQPVCKKSSSGSSSAGVTGKQTSSSKKYNANNAIKMQAMDAAIGALFSDLFAQPNKAKNEEHRQQQEMERIAAEQAAEQARQRGVQDWQQRQAEAEAKGRLDQQAKVDSGNRLLSQMQAIGDGEPTQPFGTGNVKLDLKPISENTFPSAQYTALQRMMCSAYFSNLAKKTANDDDVRFYADQAQRVMSGAPTHLECRMPKVTSGAISKRMDEIKKTYDQMGEVNDRIQDIDTKLTGTKDKITAAEAKKEQAAAAISELQNRAARATPEERNEIDDLLRQAQMLSQEADQQLQQAKQADIDLQKEREQAEKEFTTMKTQLTK